MPWPPLAQSGLCGAQRVLYGPAPLALFASIPSAPAAMLLRHVHVVPAVMLQTLDRLQAGAWLSLVAPRQQELLHRPALDYSLSTSRLLPKLCHLLLKESGTVVVQGRRDPQARQATLTLGLYANGYQLKGRPNVNTNICIIDFAGDWFAGSDHVPKCKDMVPCMAFPNVSDGERLPIQKEALQALPSCNFNQRMKYAGLEYTMTLHLQLDCLTADNHHLLFVFR